MKFLKYLGYAFLLIILCLVILIAYVYLSTNSSKSGTLQLTGLQGHVLIHRDQYGIPHIDALSSDNDAFFALGYVQAQDRFWQMEFQRRVAQGTLSEIFGKATIKQDEFLRTFGFYRAAQAAWPAFDPETKAIMQSYAAGVNAFLAQGKLPLQFTLLHYKPQRWTTIDSICWQKMMAFDLQNAWEQQITNLLITQHLGAKQLDILSPPYPRNAPTILSDLDLLQSGLISRSKIPQTPPANENNKAIIPQLAAMQTTTDQVRTALGLKMVSGKGSNNWVIKGKLSMTGKPLLANDPHLALNAPNVWYLAELRGPHLHVTGATLPGVPGVFIGHNDHIAWGVTNVNPATQTLYVESPNTPYTIIHEVIKVKGQADIDFPIKISAHGPIISGISDAGKIGPDIALKWTALLPNDTTVESMLKIDYAQNWSEFTRALKYFVVPSQNFVYADTEGNIGYYLPGLIPVHPGWRGDVPVMASEHHEWQGYIPFEQLPHVYNPSENYLASANNKAVPDSYSYPLTIHYIDPPYRIERIITLLNAKQIFTPQDFQRIQTDTVSDLWRDLRPVLLNTKPLDQHSKIGLAALKAWDGNSNLDSKGTTVFAYWYRELIKMPTQQLPFKSEWNKPLFIQEQLRTNGIYCKSATAATCADYLSQTLQSAMNQLIQKHGDNPEQWQWKKFHHAKFSELVIGKSKAVGWIWNRSIATPGSYQTVNAGTYNSAAFNQTVGPGYRQIIDLSNFDHSLYMEAFGQSDNPFTKNYADLLPLWRNGRYIMISSKDSDWGKTTQLILEPY